MKRSTALITFGWLCLLSSLASPPAHAATCRNRIPELGGRTAIRRGDKLDTVAKLKEALEKEKYKKAFEEILRQADMEGAFENLKTTVDKLQPEDLMSYKKGVELEWMAYRQASNPEVIRLLHDACWINDESFRAWTFDFNGSKLIIPEDCLNLAELKTPICEVWASANCETSEVSSRVRLESSAGYHPANLNLTLWKVEEDNQLKEVSRTTLQAPPFTWPAQKVDPGHYRFEAKVTGKKGRIEVESPSCFADVQVCPKPVCPSCSLNAQSSWSEGVLTIDASGSEGQLSASYQDGTETTTLQGEGPVWRVEVPKGDYKVTVTAARSAPNCKPVTCSTTVTVQPPVEKTIEIPVKEPCCTTPWFLRSFGLYAETQGDQERGSFRNADRVVGDFKLGFNQGIGSGFELEYLKAGRTAAGRPELTGIGWAFGLSRTPIDLTWTLDSPNFWIMDDDRVPMLLFTGGPRFHRSFGLGSSFYVGPVVAFARLDSATLADGSAKPGTVELDFDDEFGYGIELGFDTFFKDCWGWTVGGQYLKLSTEAQGIDVDIDPLLVKTGLVYRF